VQMFLTHAVRFEFPSLRRVMSRYLGQTLARSH